ncbi:MAG TPA: HD domain-containing phosphohydrolase [Solirubrobacteraceae bacterium]|nr:HD domain-containing phosphohydrolase [Solirubrobacteraceae bacterium]
MSQYALLALGLWLLTLLAALVVVAGTRTRGSDPLAVGKDVPALGRWLRRVFAADPAGARQAAAVAAHARWLGSVVGLSRVEHGHVYVAALLHGVERLDVDLDALPWDQEDAEVRTLASSFAARGVHMLRDVSGLEPAARIATACGERVDGTGHPRGLAGDAIPMGARIIAVAEAYVDQLQGEGGAHEPLPPAAALERIAGQGGTALDAALVDAFSAQVSKAMIDVTWSAQDTAWLMSPRGSSPI